MVHSKGLAHRKHPTHCTVRRAVFLDWIREMEGRAAFYGTVIPCHFTMIVYITCMYGGWCLGFMGRVVFLPPELKLMQVICQNVDRC